MPVVHTRLARSIALTATILAAASGVAACSSTAKTASNTSNTSSNAGSSTGGGLAQAKADVQKFLMRPTDFGITQPIGKPVPTGKTIDFIYCGVPICSVYGDAVTRAAKILGWTTDVITTQGTPESIKAAWDTAVRNKPAAVISTGWDTPNYAPELAQLKAMNIPVFNDATTDPGPTGNVTARIQNGQQNGLSGTELAAWIVADSSGAAKTLYVNLPAYAILADTQTAFNTAYASYCPGCKLEHMDLPLTVLGKDAPATVVTYLRSHPDINYIAFSVDAAAIGVPAALKAAGLAGKVKFAGISGTTQNLQYVKDGDETATINHGYFEEMYSLVDSAARVAAGAKLDEVFKYQVPFWIDTKDTITSTTGYSPVVPNIDQKAAQLWGK